MPKLYGGPGPRTIHPSMRTSRSLARCSVGAQLLFDRLIIAADDQGRLLGDPVLVKAECFPLLPGITLAHIRRWLAELEGQEMLTLYEKRGEGLIQLVGWWGAQPGMRRAYPSRWQPPDGWTDRVFGLGSDAFAIQNGHDLRADSGQRAAESPQHAAVSAQSAPSRAPAEPNRTEPNPAQPREREHARGTGSKDPDEPTFTAIREPLSQKLKELRNGHAEAAPPPSPASTPARKAAATTEVDPDE